MISKLPILSLLLTIAPITVGLAVEGAVGRPVSGVAVNPFAAVIPPGMPGFSVSVSEIYYDADIGGNRATPVGANLALGLDTQISFTNFALTYIWDVQPGRWNFASGVFLPLASVEVEANVTAGPLTGTRSETETGLFDIGFIPVFASYHISETEHLGLNLTVWAPTGNYDSANLANLGLNTWTFIPTVAYTRMWKERGIEFSAAWGMQFYTENDATNYQNGIVSDLEAAAIQRFPNGLGIGLIGSWIQQVSDDDSPAADRLDGFSGRAFGVGPVLTYTSKLGNNLVDFNARWIHEFGVEKRFEGNVFGLSASVKF